MNATEPEVPRLPPEWLNAARTMANSSASSCTSTGGALRIRSRTTVLVTFGAGTKQCGGTSNSSSSSAYHAVSTVSRP